MFCNAISNLQTILCDIPLERIESVRFVSSTHVEKEQTMKKRTLFLRSICKIYNLRLINAYNVHLKLYQKTQVPLHMGLNCIQNLINNLETLYISITSFFRCKKNEISPFTYGNLKPVKLLIILHETISNVYGNQRII